MNYELLIGFISATAVLAISPGPDNIYVLMQGMVHGTRSGLATTAGLISGCIVHTTLLAFGLSLVIARNESLYAGIKLFGAAYLLYLAYQVWRSSSDVQLQADGVPARSQAALFRQGFIMNVLNPKVTIFFLAFFPGFLFHDRWSTVVQFYILGFLFMLVSFIIFSGIAISAGKIARYFKEYPNTGMVLKWLQIVVFVGIAGYLLWSWN